MVGDPTGAEGLVAGIGSLLKMGVLPLGLKMIKSNGREIAINHM
jgi:hypothetical protein